MLIHDNQFPQSSSPTGMQLFDLFLFVDHELRRQYYMKAKTFDKQFDEGVDITAALELSKAKRVLQEQKRVNVDFPTWMIESLDREARKLGITRQSIIKVWLAERLEESASNTTFQRTRRDAALR